MTGIFPALDAAADVAPEDESAQPIVIRKLDRLEATLLCSWNS